MNDILTPLKKYKIFRNLPSGSGFSAQMVRWSRVVAIDANIPAPDHAIPVADDEPETEWQSDPEPTNTPKSFPTE